MPPNDKREDDKPMPPAYPAPEDNSVAERFTDPGPFERKRIDMNYDPHKRRDRT